MPIEVTSSCGKTFSLKDELAGQLVKCPDCGEELRVDGDDPQATPPPIEGMDPAFNRSKFLLRQKHFAISEKYSVWDETGETIMFIQRPAHIMRNLLAIFVGLIAGGFIWAGLGAIAASLSNDTAVAIMVAITVLAGIFTVIAVSVPLSVKRHTYFYRDDSKGELLMTVEQDHKFTPIVATYTVLDQDGKILAKLKKNYLFNFIRKRWLCLRPDGTLWSVIKEDSLLMALLRRFIVAWKVNFVFHKGDSEQIIGEFNRKLTLLDRYVLDFTKDPTNFMDRRVALAAGVMLDTGERR